MSGWWYGGFLVVTVCVVVVNSKFEPDSPLRISICKSFCLAECLNTCLHFQGMNTSKNCSFPGCMEGCKHVCQPHSGSTVLDSPLVQARIIVRGLGLDKSLELTDAQEPPNGHVNESNMPKTERTLWRLQEVSRIHQSALVLVQISWLPQQLTAASQPVYLVTWEVGGGVLRGNLLTNSSRASLSLWSHTVYRIQVSVFSGSSQGRQSEPLVVDTHFTPALDLTGSVLSSPPRTASLVPDTQLAAGLVAAVAMFLLATLVLTWRRRHMSFPHSKLFVEECESPNIYRVFPPAVRLLSDWPDSTVTFSSRENLLSG